ncbi:unnamed protein product, partial [Callosobruchus maculatus]
FHNFYLNALKG